MLRNFSLLASPEVVFDNLQYSQWQKYLNIMIFLLQWNVTRLPYNVNGLVQERRNSSALAMELRLSCTNPLM